MTGGLSRLLLRGHGLRLRSRGLHSSASVAAASISQQPLWSHGSASLRISSQEAMEALGARVAAHCRAGDVLFLKGDLGCGKTCFARGFIRALTGDSALHVTSPTYLLVNTYEDESGHKTPVIYHVDLYRLDSVSALDQEALGLKHAFQTGISLVEWSERLDAASVPTTRLDVLIEYDEQQDTGRNVALQPFGDRWETNQKQQ